MVFLMKINWGENALFYCNVRIISNIVVAVTLAVLSLIVSYQLNKLTSDFQEAKAQIISVQLNKENSIYYPIYKISFINNNKETITELRDISIFFPDEKSGQDFINNEKQKESINILYSKLNPNDILIKGQEKMISSTFALIASSLVVFALLSYILLGNALYCGFVIFRDIFTIFRI